MKTIEIKIETNYITLNQFLKLSSIVQTGGHAKVLIQDGEVKVNDNLCLQRGKKLYKGDIVEILGNKKYEII
ncbi:MAG TPA: S4 domain-containing protein YaaA [Tissierellaceae bacterium]|nr:S4 domain-containing protein YaaA [Tissierellaceae bacterium]